MRHCCRFHDYASCANHTGLCSLKLIDAAEPGGLGLLVNSQLCLAPTYTLCTTKLAGSRLCRGVGQPNIGQGESVQTRSNFPSNVHFIYKMPSCSNGCKWRMSHRKQCRALRGDIAHSILPLTVVLIAALVLSLTTRSSSSCVLD